MSAHHWFGASVALLLTTLVAPLPRHTAAPPVERSPVTSYAADRVVVELVRRGAAPVARRHGLSVSLSTQRIARLEIEDGRTLEEVVAALRQDEDVVDVYRVPVPPGR